MRKALITGITGQDGSYLAELLLEKGYEVHGIVRRSSTENFERIGHLAGRLTLHQADLLDQLSIIDVLKEVRPQEVYNLAAMSFVPTSWKQPVLTGEFTAMGVTRVLEAIRLLDPQGIRFYQASSSEAFGHVGLDWRKHVVQDPGLVRPAEVDLLIGDPGKARRQLGWEPTVDFRGLIRRMVEADLGRLRKG